MYTYETITCDTDARGVARVTLNRPARRNAINPALIREVTEAFTRLGDDPSVRLIILQGAGPVFCAGADIEWMHSAGAETEAQTAVGSRALQTMMLTVDACPKLVVGAIHGAAMAGGLGLVACCDIAIATADAKFCLSEVKLGLVPGVVSTFLIPRLGGSNLRYLATSARVIDGRAAQGLGLVHEQVEDEAALQERVAEHIELALKNSPEAVVMCKRLLREIGAYPVEASYAPSLAWNVRARRSETGQEGMRAFLDRDTPSWAKVP